MATQKEQASQYKPGERVRYLAGKGQAEHVGEVVSIGPDGVIRVKNAADMLVSVRPDRVVKENPAESTPEAATATADAPAASGESTTIVNETVNELKAITIVQPYASLIALPESHPGHKRVENRTWETAHRGLIAIHAGKADSYNGRPCADIAKEYGYDGPLPLGDIVAVADLVDCVDTRTSGTPAFEKHGLAGHRHIEGPVCFVLKNVRALPEPIPCRGAQQIWTVPEATAAKVKKAMENIPNPITDAEVVDAEFTIVPETPAEKPKEEPAKTADTHVPDITQWVAIVEARKLEADAAAEVEELKEELKGAKDAHEKAVARLTRLIDEARFPNLFTQRVTPSTPAEAAKVEASATPKPAPAEPVADDAWRAEPISALGLKEKLVEKLADAGMGTLGQLSDWVKKRYEPKVAGVGSGTMTAIEDAFFNYWQKNPRPSPAAVILTPAGLKWEKDEEGWYAANTAGITIPDNAARPIAAGFFLDPITEGEHAGKWTIDGSDSLIPDLEQVPKHMPLDDAKAWCEQRNSELAAKAAAVAAPPLAALVWQALPRDDRRNYIYADNTAGIFGDGSNEDGSPTLATFRIERVAEDKFSIDVSDDVLMPVDFPDSFPSEDAAKTWCENRNATLAAAKLNEAIAA